MTLPRLAAMRNFWKDNPPVRVMLQAKWGMRKSEESNAPTPIDDKIILDPDQALSFLPGFSESVGGGLNRG